MSPDPVRLHAAPAAIRVAAEGLEVLRERMERERLREEFERGRRDGERHAMESTAGLLHAACERLEQLQGEVRSQLPRAAVELALEIAKELLRREVDAGRYDIEAIVRSTMARAELAHLACVIHVHPDDAQALSGASFRPGLRVEGDPEIARGCVHVTTPQGLLVRDLRDAFDATAERLLEEHP